MVVPLEDEADSAKAFVNDEEDDEDEEDEEDEDEDEEDEEDEPDGAESEDDEPRWRPARGDDATMRLDVKGVFKLARAQLRETARTGMVLNLFRLSDRVPCGPSEEESYYGESHRLGRAHMNVRLPRPHPKVLISVLDPRASRAPGRREGPDRRLVRGALLHA